MSTDLLDQCLAAGTNGTPTGPTVLRQQHDANQINWVGGVTDPGEMIGCGKYQELRRHDGEADAAYQERLTALLPTLPKKHREQIEKAMKAAALKRAGLDVSNGRVNLLVAGQPAWHGLGVQVAEAVDSADALRLAGLDWAVAKQTLSYAHPLTGLPTESEDVFGIIRQDTGAQLGSVGKLYQPIQNADGFAMLDGVLAEFGAKYETAGSLHGGKRVFMLVRLPAQCFDVAGGDHVEAYALFTNPHDGSGAAECFATSERVVCHNTLRVARGKARGGLRIRHTGDLKEKAAEARRALNITARQFEDFSDHAEVLAHTPVPEIRHYCNDVLDAVLDVTLAEVDDKVNILEKMLAVHTAEAALEAKSFERKCARRGEVLEDILARYESERCGVHGIRGTAWAALNAVTESADHGKLGGRPEGEDVGKQSRRFESILVGDADRAKQAAYEAALALVA